MLFTRLANSGTIPALEKLAAFTEARQRVLAENIANIDNPDYQVRQLDTKAFQRTLRQAIDACKANGSTAFVLTGNDQVSQDAAGRLQVHPVNTPPENILFHDQTNARVERQMAMLAENTMMHQTATELLRGRYEGLLKAIRGRMS